MTQPLKRSSGVVWPLAIIGLLAMSFTICGITVYAALKDPASTVVVNDYYQRAVDWDANRNAWRSPTQAGWIVTETLQHRDGRSIVHVEIAGRDSDEGLHAVVYHKAHADDKAEIMLVRTAQGIYEGVLPSNLPGLWSIEITDKAQSVRTEHVLELGPE